MILIKNLRFIRRGGFKTKNFLTPICLLILLTIIACSPTTEISKGNLIGVIALEGMEDNSAIIVAIYDLAVLDTTIVRINNEYPQIGVKITQHTEFDHRLQSPIKITETIADGSFEIDKIPTGIYNLVAMKADYGFKYLYEIEITEGDNEISQARCHPEPFVKLRTGLIEGRSEISELTPQPAPPRRINLLSTIEGKPNDDGVILHAGAYPAEAGEDWTNLSRSSLKEGSQPTTHNSQLTNRTSDLTLFPEHHISGNILDDVIVLPWHHLIIDNDTYFVPGSLLTLMANSIVRINPGCDLKIYGEITAQGEENNMFWITSNHGFDVNSQFSILNSQLNSKFKIKNSTLPNRSEELLVYNSLELSSIASVSNNLIKWGKWDWGNLAFSSLISNISLNNLCFKYSESNFIISNASNVMVLNITSVNCINEFAGGIAAFNVDGLEVVNNVLWNNYSGFYSKFSSEVIIRNNYFTNNFRGIWGLSLSADIEHNEFLKNTESDVKWASSLSTASLDVKLNTMKSNKGVWQYDQASFHDYGSLSITNNNLFNNFFSQNTQCGSLGYIDMTGNYFDGLKSIIDIRERIIGVNNESLIIDDFTTNIITNAGIL